MGTVPSRTRRVQRGGEKTEKLCSVGAPSKRNNLPHSGKCVNFTEKAAKINNTMMHHGCKEEEGGLSIFLFYLFILFMGWGGGGEVAEPTEVRQEIVKLVDNNKK